MTAPLFLALAASFVPALAANPLQTAPTGQTVQNDELETHPFGVDDMLAMQRISGPTVSPDRRWVAFTLRTTDLEANRGRTDVWVAPTSGPPAPRRLTTHEASDHSPVWSPDGGTLFFLSTRGGSSQVWRLSLEGGEAQQVTRFPLDVGNFGLIDGERLWFTAEVWLDAETLAQSAERDAERAADPVQARLYDRLPIRHWDTWEDARRSHVFAWRMGSDEAPLDLMAGLECDTPTKPFGGSEEIAVSPDGRELVFAAKLEGRGTMWSTNVDLWRVPTDGSQPAVRLTANNPAYDNAPAFSPDGRFLAWLAMERPGYESDRQHIVLLDRKSGEQRALTADWDRSVSELAWSSNGARLLVTADDVGNHALFTVDATNGKPTKVVGRGTCGSPQEVAGGRLLFAHDNLRSPVELQTVTFEGTDLRAVTTINASRVAAARTGSYEQFSFEGAHGDTVHGYVVRPADFDPTERYPVAFLIHGGPQGSFGDHFHYRWNPQAYAGAGYAAVMIDFHGSTGYGQAFCDAIRGDWGGAPFEDLMKGLDAALEKYSFLDGQRVAALGASYGGYMINWIAGQTDRFRCLVNHDGNLDERMAYFDTEELWFPEWDHQGLPWEAPEHYAKHNPVLFVADWKTPMLVIHGALDYRVVDTQGMSTFTALQRRGIPSRFLYFPDENHWVLKPKNSQLWHATVLEWLAEWVPRSGG